MPGTSLLLTALLAAAPRAAAQEAAVEAARAHRAAEGPRILADLAALLAIPDVTGELDGLRRNAAAIVELFGRRGVELRTVALDGVAPVVVGSLPAPGAERTLGLYVHYDGQPVQAEAWASPPFEPTLRTAPLEEGGTTRPFPAPGEPVDPGWLVYARGAGDDRAPLIALAEALAALERAGIARTSNLVFLFEGEEESGSPHLGAYLERLAGELAADLWLVCDGPLHPSGRPQLVFGVRGICGLELTVYGPSRPLHSGHYGNWAPNPAMMLARLLASMKDDEGHVLVEGFYDDVQPLGERERAALERLPDVDGELRRELGLARTEGGGASLAETLLLPSLNVRGLTSAVTGEAARNVVPERASASIDMRLVAGNRPGRMLDLVEAHIRAQGYTIVREEPDLATRLAHPRIARVTRDEGYPAARTPMDHPLVPALEAAARAARAGSGAPADVILTPALGGSLPLYLFRDVLHAPLVIVPIANHDDNQHAADENVRVANLWYGVDLFAAILAMP